MTQQLTILLFGATGNIGGHAAEALARGGKVRVRAAVRPDSQANLDHLNALGVEIVRADLSDPASLAPAFAGVDRAFLVNSLFALDAMAEHTENFLVAARAAGVKRIVRSGGAPFPKCEIADLHDAAQRQFCDAGIAWALVRPNFYNSNLLWSAGTIKDHGAFYLPLGDARIAWTDPADIGAVIAHALVADDADGKMFHVTGPDAIDGHTVASAITASIARAKQDRNTLTAIQFNMLDTDGDGRIDRAELAAHLGKHGFAVAEIDALLDVADMNQDGKISLNELRLDAVRAGAFDASPTVVRYMAVDDASARSGMQGMGVPDRTIDLMLGLYAQLRAGGAEQLGRGVQEALGREPQSVVGWSDAHVGAFIPTHWETLKQDDRALRPSSIG